MHRSVVKAFNSGRLGKLEGTRRDGDGSVDGDDDSTRVMRTGDTITRTGSLRGAGASGVHRSSSGVVRTNSWLAKNILTHQRSKYATKQSSNVWNRRVPDYHFDTLLIASDESAN
jgi:hypothetical protein